MAEKEVRVRKKKKLGSYPSVSVIFSITLSLFIIGLFGLLLLHTNKLSEIIKDNIEIQVYLNKDITQNQRIQVLKTLSSKDYVLKSDEEAQISFVSKETAEKKFIEETGEDFKDFLGENPLRDAYTVKIASDFQNAEKLGVIKQDLEEMSAVFEVAYSENLVDSINKNMTKIGLLLLSFASILLLVVVVLINNTIKLALFSQRFLIRSMQLVGAKSSFIQRPFITRALLYGLIGGIIASGILYSVMQYANTKVQDLSTLQEMNKIVILYIILIALGGFIGLASTYRAVKKYLRLSLDELY